MQYIFFALITGSTLALAAVGFALVRQTEGFLNIAHGQFMLLGAFVAHTLATTYGLNLGLAIAITVPLIGLAGLATAWLVFFPLRDKGLLAQFFSSVGVAFIVYGIVSALWSGRAIKVFPITSDFSIAMPGFSATAIELGIVIGAWLAVLSLHLFLAHTRVGTSIRAIAGNAELARARGINVRLAIGSVWFVGTALAGLSGILIGLIGGVGIELGWHYILIILAVAVLGGLRTLYGVLIGGLLVGAVIELSTLVVPSKYGVLIAFGLIVVTLLVKPEGIVSVSKRKEASA
ncbi:branched-chain amino acid ABC transporter permease [Aquamicrobium terrae]|uniref:Neutral amino acid transport system permease protein n=1 Tax=Aquamicrobium terrae TaxID=1324945 RepID=A0ABV2N6R3_9HYPH